MRTINYVPILILISIITIIASKLFTPFIGILISIISLLGLGIAILYQKISLEYKLKKEKKSKEQKRLLEEKQKQEEYARIFKERKIHIEKLRQSGIKELDYKCGLNEINVATNINLFQKDLIMVTFFGGKLIFYSIDIIEYQYLEVLHIKEFSYNTYNAIEMIENKNMVIVYGYPGIKILEVEINNKKGKEGNKYKVIQRLNCSDYNEEIIKVIELDNQTLVSISTDYLLIWDKINNEYKISNKILNFSKYENLLILSNLLKLDANNIVLLKQANSNMTKSTVDFIEITEIDIKEKKLVNLDISPLDTGNNNLFLYDKNDKIFFVGCLTGLAIMSGKYMELIQFIELGQIIKNIDDFFDKFFIFYGKFGGVDKNQKEYTFIQMEKTGKNFEKRETINKKSLCIHEDINTMKYFKDGIFIIGDHGGFLQLWH